MMFIPIFLTLLFVFSLGFLFGYLHGSVATENNLLKKLEDRALIRKQDGWKNYRWVDSGEDIP